MNENTLTPQA